MLWSLVHEAPVTMFIMGLLSLAFGIQRWWLDRNGI